LTGRKTPGEDTGGGEARRQADRPPEPGLARLAVLFFELDLGPDLGEVGVDVALVDRLGGLDLGGRELVDLGPGRLAFGGLQGNQPGPLGDDGVLLAVGVELRDGDALIVGLGDREAGTLDVEDRVERRDQPEGARLDLEDQLAVLGLALVEGLGDLQLVERPMVRALGRGNRSGGPATRRA